MKIRNSRKFIRELINQEQLWPYFDFDTIEGIEELIIETKGSWRSNWTILNNLSVHSEALQLAAIKANPANLSLIKNPTKEAILRALEANPDMIAKIDDPSEETQLRAVGASAHAIRHIKNPCHAAIMKALEKAPHVIGILQNPTVEMQAFACRVDPSLITVCKTPDLETQLYVVSKNGHLLQYIKNPSEEVKSAAIKHSPNAIRHVDNPSPALQLLAVTIKANAIKYIKKPCFEAQEMALQKDDRLLRLRNIDIAKKSTTMSIQDGYLEMFIRTAVSARPDLLRYVNSPSSELQQHIINTSAHQAMQWLQDMDEETQLAAIERDIYFLNHIKHPTKAVQLKVVTKNPNTIRMIADPEDEVWETAIRAEPKVVETYPGEIPYEFQKLAVTLKASVLKHLKNPTPELQMLAITRNPIMIKDIQNASKEMQLLAVRADGHALQYIKDADEDVEIVAIHQALSAVKWCQGGSRYGDNESLRPNVLKAYKEIIRAKEQK